MFSGILIRVRKYVFSEKFSLTEDEDEDAGGGSVEDLYSGSAWDAEVELIAMVI